MAIDVQKLVGRRFFTTNWFVEGVLGEGGMGVVLQVVKEPGIQGAMKIMQPHLAERSDYIDNFMNEVRLQVRLQRHENIVQIFDYGELQDGTLYFVMELLLGPAGPDGSPPQASPTLRQIIRKFDKPLPPPHTYEIVSQIAQGLDYAHASKIVHRDLKPENLFFYIPPQTSDHLGGRARIKIGDFGIASLADGKRVNGTFGTPKYISPEQLRRDPITPRADLYALALITYEMLTGRFPWDLPNDAEKMSRLHLYAPPVPPKEHAPWVPDSVNAVILKALSKHPEDRPADVVEFSHALLELQFCSGVTSTGGLDDNSTDPSFVTLASFVSDQQEEPPPDAGGSRSTARRMKTPPIEGRSLELAPRHLVTEPLAHAAATAGSWGSRGTGDRVTAPTDPVGGGSVWPSSASRSSNAFTDHAQSDGGTASPVLSTPSGRRSDADAVLSISRKTVYRTLVVVPIMLASLAIIATALLAHRGGTSAGTAPPAEPLVAPAATQLEGPATAASSPSPSATAATAASATGAVVPSSTSPPTESLPPPILPAPPATPVGKRTPPSPPSTAPAPWATPPPSLTTSSPTASHRPADSKPDDGRDLLMPVSKP